jgi:ribosomal protein S4
MNKLIFNFSIIEFFKNTLDIFRIHDNQKKVIFNTFKTVNISRETTWMHKTIRRAGILRKQKKNMRIFFFKRNKFFRNLSNTLNFSRQWEVIKRTKRQLVFINWIKFLYGIKRLFFLSKKVIFVKNKLVRLVKMQLILSILERHLIIVLLRMVFVVNLIWAKYLILKRCIFVNGLICCFKFYTIQNMDMLTLYIKQKKNLKRGKFYKNLLVKSYVNWLVLKKYSLYKLFLNTLVKFGNSFKQKYVFFQIQRVILKKRQLWFFFYQKVFNAWYKQQKNKKVFLYYGN